MLPIRALEYDLARSRRADIVHLEHMAADLAELGFNMMTLNLEHRFDFPGCPGIAPPGSLTPAMARRLVAFGRERGLEVVPQPNLIGHCEGICAIQKYAHLSADPHRQQPWGGYEQLNLELPEARDLVRTMLAGVCDSFPGRYLHIGGDEVRRMDCLFPDRDPAFRLEKMLEHFQFVLELARAHGRTVMIWGDMPLHHEELLRALPKDIMVCDWHYGPEGSRATLARYRDQGFQTLAAPSVATYAGYGPLQASKDNIRSMVGDAVELGLAGFLLTTWEFGFGTAPDLIWPWCAYAMEIANGRAGTGFEDFAAAFMARRHGIDGTAWLRLVQLLDTGVLDALRDGRDIPTTVRVTLRKNLFRGAPALPAHADLRPKGFPQNHHIQVWAPSPFIAWLSLRPLLTPAALAKLAAVAAEAAEIAEKLLDCAGARRAELLPWAVLARALAVFVERADILGRAQDAYRQAAAVQRHDPAEFAVKVADSANLLERLRPGMQTLRRAVFELDALCGLDAGEIKWLDIQEQSLDTHQAALGMLRAEDDALLEFGEFLRRPANVSQRLTWR